jgi:hypothetical protein
MVCRALSHGVGGLPPGLQEAIREWNDVGMKPWNWLAFVVMVPALLAAEPRSVSGIYPQLAMFNDSAECGTGAVVPWAGKLWVITYSPHKPHGSDDKLYEITPALEQIIRPESIGGTPANRMIHRESQQLFIGPYVVDAKGGVRAIPYNKMFGRPTGNARHLTDPAGKVYLATMEEGLYEIDVKSLAVTELWADEQKKTGRHSDLPGYHGKGLYSGFGQIIYANNGDHAPEARLNPAVPSGVLAEWDGKADKWTVVRRNQFTEVTGPGGIYGNEHPDRDPVWTIGWDHRSLILQVRDAQGWQSYRLPKGSHSYDGAHGWNTEWPRIREIGGDALLMTMHGTFWRFPKTFSRANSAGLVPRSNYIKVIGDFCRWNDRLVFGCDDTAKSEFLNKRKAKGELAGPGRSQSNLWFVDEPHLDELGPVIGRGAVWQDDAVKSGETSDAYLFSGYTHRLLQLAHQSAQAVTFTLEMDVQGNGQWAKLRELVVPAKGAVWTEFTRAETGVWVRLKAGAGAEKVTAFFHYRNADERPAAGAPMFASLATADAKSINGGLLHARGADFKTLRFIASDAGGDLGCYDLGGDLKLRKTNDAAGIEWTKKAAAIPRNVLTVDAASVLYVDESGRWRLPKGALESRGILGDERVCREVCTERDLFNAGGTFFELPAENAGGFAKVRPVATHNRQIKDYASFRGLLVMSGLSASAPAGDHVVRSDDGKCALWVGAVDDLWKLGKPRGVGGPWKDTAVKAGQPSDPYLMTGYDQKRVILSHTGKEAVKVRLEADLSGTGIWVAYREFTIEAGKPVDHTFPAAYSAYWMRAVVDKDTTATAEFRYD